VPIVRGQIVRSKAGKDKESFLVVADVCEKGVFVCDGKDRPLERPKLKNLRHIAPTNSFLTEEQLSTNRSVRHGLRDFNQSLQGDE
jgi:ribosomal protein L14E/L6E/L27E